MYDSLVQFDRTLDAKECIVTFPVGEIGSVRKYFEERKKTDKSDILKSRALFRKNSSPIRKRIVGRDTETT